MRRSVSQIWPIPTILRVNEPALLSVPTDEKDSVTCDNQIVARPNTRPARRMLPAVPAKESAGAAIKQTARPIAAIETHRRTRGRPRLRINQVYVSGGL